MKMKHSRFWLIAIPVVIYLAVWSNIGRHVNVGQKDKELRSVQEITRLNQSSAKEGVDLGIAVTVQSFEQTTTNTGKSVIVQSSKQAVAEEKSGFDGALVSGHQPKAKRLMTIAIPTISRPKGIGYLKATLNSLIDNSTPEQRRSLLIVILLADFNQTAKDTLNRKLLTTFQDHFDSGLIQTVQAPKSYYPTLENLKRTYNHPLDQVKWRAKQNFDYAFLMEYSENKSVFYLQLEDDVTTVRGYFEKITKYIGQIPVWTCLEFCDLGFIAKLYQNTDIVKLAQFLKLFFNEQPNDVLYLHFNELMTQFRRFVRKPTIFQHKGVISSLSSKIAMLRDVYFEGDGKERKSTNGTRRGEPKAPELPVQFRQLGRVMGPEMSVWRQRKRDEKRLNKKIHYGPDHVH